MANFKIDDQVELIPGNYDEESNNPTKTRGVITRILGGDYCYYVSWDNGETNSYRKYELKSYLMPDIKAKVGDIIHITNTKMASWLEIGHDYVVQAINPMNCTIKVNDDWWHCKNDDYNVVGSQAGESPFDREILDAQRRRIAKENALQKAAKHYPAGTKFKSMRNSDVYTIADTPEYSWSENTEGIYAWAANNLDILFRVYICKRDDWAEIIYKDLLGEAKEMFPPGTRFVNSYGTTSTVSDDPEYSLANGFVFAKCKTGSLVRIHTGVKWAEIVTRPSSSDTTRRKPQNGDQIYITQHATGCIAKYKNQWVEVKEISYEENDALYMRFPDGDRYIVLKSEWSWTESEQETPSTSEFNVGDVVQVTEDCAYFNIGHVSTIIKVDPGSVLMRNHKDGDWWISKDHIRHHFHSLFDKVEIPQDVKDTKELYKNLFYNLKTKQHGTESNKSVKLQRVNLQIREGNISRGIGLKGSGSKIKLGSNYRYD